MIGHKNKKKRWRIRKEWKTQGKEMLKTGSERKEIKGRKQDKEDKERGEEKRKERKKKDKEEKRYRNKETG